MRLIRSDEPMTEKMFRYKNKQDACQAFAWVGLVIFIICLAILFLGLFSGLSGHEPFVLPVATASILVLAVSSAVHWCYGRKLKKASSQLDANTS